MAVVAVVAGCESFLPGGKAPEGVIVDNPETTVATLKFDYRKALDYFINELSRETMLYCAGEAVFVDADGKSSAAANYIVARTGELSGIRHGSSATGSCRLVSRLSKLNQWELELISTDGKSLWKRTVLLQN